MQNREPPAYQEYPASILAKAEFRMMTPSQIGLLYKMRLECWVNRKLPSDMKRLAKYLNWDDEQLKSDFSNEVRSFFKEESGFFYSPELEDYRQYLENKRIAQSNGGKQGAAKTNAKKNRPRKPENANDASKPSANSQPPYRGGVESLVQSSTVKQSQTQSLEGDNNTEWLNDYDRASNGN